MLEVVARLEDRRVHLLHRIAELDAEPRQNVALPRVVLGVHARLHLLVVHDAHAKLLLRLRRVEQRARALDLGQQLLPVRERVPQPVEHVFRLEVPQRLELQPLRDVVLQLLHFALYESERALQCVVCEARELGRRRRSAFVGLPGTTSYCSPTRYIVFPMPCSPAFEVRFHISNFESAVADKSHLEGHLVNTKPTGELRVVFTEPVV